MPTIWAKNEDEAARIRAARPDADIQVAPRKQKSGETREQRQARQAAQVRQRAAQLANRPAPAPREIVRPSALHRLSGMRVPGGRRTVGAALIATGAAAGYGVGQLRKADSDTARRAAVGAGATYGAYLGAGYSASHAARFLGRKDKKSSDLMGNHARQYGFKPGPIVGQGKSVKEIEAMYRTTPAGVKFSGTKRLLARTHGVSGTGRLAVPVLAAGAAGGAMYDRAVRKSTNIREYPNLPEWVKEDGIPRTRRNPINPLQMYSSGLIMQDAKSGHGRRLKNKARRRVGNEELMYTGGRAMLYSPLGIGALR